MTTHADILIQVQDTMVDLFETKREKIVLSAKLVDDLGLDSIDAIDLAARFEELTGQRLREDGLLNLRTVEDVVVYLDKCIQERDLSKKEQNHA
jgi:acyl carrier protein